MTTEAGSETEVKEKAEESAAEPDQSEKATEDSQEVANAEVEEKERAKVKEKEGKEGKGISRYLPTWLKKQKSQSQVKLGSHCCYVILSQLCREFYFNYLATIVFQAHFNCWCINELLC